jgi:adenine-specific DNA glycosylase
VAGKNERLQETAEQRYFAWPRAEDNAVLRLARQRLFGDPNFREIRTAAAQQALLQIVRDFCQHSNALCEQCPFPELVKSLRGQRTIVFSSHILSEVSQVAQRVVIINRGRIVAEDRPEGLARRIEGTVTVWLRAEAPLREAYNFAIQKTTNSADYEEALWATAHLTHFERQLKDIYERSYLPVMEYRKPRMPIPIAKFRTRLYSLCSPTHGDILSRKRNSWYAFRENVLRGYVRLIAERNSVPLGSDHF